jgi:hypothetical protein
MEISDPPHLKGVAKGLANAYGVRDHVRYLSLGLKQPQAGIKERLRRYVCPRLALISKYIDAVSTTWRGLTEEMQLTVLMVSETLQTVETVYERYYQPTNHPVKTG